MYVEATYVINCKLYPFMLTDYFKVKGRLC